MNLDLLLLAAADGFSYAGLLFLVALGLTLIFGVQGILNVAHGSLYAFGGYTAVSLTLWLMEHTQASTPLLFAALIVAAIVAGTVLGGVLELLLRRVQGKDPVLQLLVTFGAFLIFEDVQKMLWGVSPMSAGELVGRLGTVDLFGVTYMAYQLLLVPGIALVLFLGVHYVLRFTRLGKQVVAVAHNREVATALGIDARKVGLLTFVGAAILGAFGGALAAPTTTLVPGIGADMIVLSFAVVATAGLGQITGAFIAALMIGLARSVAVYMAPEFDVAVPYLIMVAVLLIRPNGLFVVAQARRI
ncbi:MAG: branched-chain amino acid ABC transporter permease [Corticimicrobacter sp.]|uniref:branched-chain amino acid ABC transporter permease n=1 Tax=Corticimicrobacter sp. TaxID=2678536 RepID=UPI0032DB6F23